MAYNPEEQEQLEAFKAWWSQHGTRVTLVVSAIAVVLISWAGWNQYRQHNVQEAAAVYESLRDAMATQDSARIKQQAGLLFEKYSSSSYASMAGLLAAKDSLNHKDTKTAKARLQWVIEHGQAEYRPIARLRLAGILLDEGAADAALEQLDPKSGGKVPKAYQALYADRRGDILLAKKQETAAREAYQTALQALKEGDPYRQILQLKLDGLGQ